MVVQYGLLHIRTFRGITHSPREKADDTDLAASGLALYKFLSAQLLGPDPLDLNAVHEPRDPGLVPENDMTKAVRSILKRSSPYEPLTKEELQEKLGEAEAIVPKIARLDDREL